MRVYMMFVYTVVYFDIEQIEPPMVGRQSPSFKGSFSRSAWLMWLSHLLQPCDAAWDGIFRLQRSGRIFKPGEY